MHFQWDVLLDGSIWFRIFVSALCGVLIGIERELKHKAAGLRTTMLICLGASLYVMVGELIATNAAGGFDPTRISAQVVTGIGFLGAGVIIHQGLNIHGLTTAATIWLVAAVGVVVGTGFPLMGLAITVFVLFMLTILRRIEKRFFPHGERPDLE